MSQISDVVKVTIYIQNVGIPRAGFGIPLLMAPSLDTPLDRVAYYAQTEEPHQIGGSVGTANAPLVKAFNASFTPSPKLTQVGVGRIKSRGWFLGIDGSPISAGTYGFTLNWKYDSGENEGDEGSQIISYVATYGDEAEIFTGLALAINNATTPFTAAVIGSSYLLITSSETSPSEAPLMGMDAFVQESGVTWQVHLYFGSVDIATEGDMRDLYSYEIEINGEEFSFTTGGAATRTELYEGWAADIGANVLGVIPLIVGGVDPIFVLINDEASARLDVSFPNSETELAFEHGYLETPSEAFDACRLASGGWYPFGMVDRSKQIQALCADKAETQITVFGYASSDRDQTEEDDGGDSIGAYCSTKNFTRTWGIFHPQATGYYNEADATDARNEEWIDFGWFGARLTVNLDTETATWKFANMAGFTPTSLSSTQKTRLFGNPISGGALGGLRMNMCDSIGGRSIIREGCVHSGEWVDTMIGRDWLVARMQEDVFAALAASKKVPYTDDGIAIIVNQIHARLKLAQGTGFLAFDEALGPQGYLLTYPLRGDVAAADRQSRLLNNIVWQASLAGAIHLVGIIGTVSA